MLGNIACGEPIFADEDRESFVDVMSDIDADFCLRASGDSMVGARICDGDLVFIKQVPMVENGDIAAVIIGGASMSGGRGTLRGTLAGILILGIVSNILDMWGVSATLQGLVKGLVIIISVLIQKKG